MPVNDDAKRVGSDPAAGARALALGALAAFVVVRLHVSGLASHFDSPSTNAAIETIGWMAVALTLLASLLGSSAPGGPTRPAGRSTIPAIVPVGLIAFVVVCAVSALRAPHADVAIRTAVSWTTHLAVAAAAFALVRSDRAALREVVALLGATALSAALLGLYEYTVEWDEMRRFYETAEGRAAAFVPANLRGAFEGRLYERAAMGPFLISNLLGAFIAVAAPFAIAPLTALAARPGRAGGVRGVAIAGLVATVAIGVAGLLVTKSKGALIAAAAAAAVAALVVAFRKSRRTGAIAGAVLVVAGGGVLGAGIHRWRTLPDSGVALSLQYRLEYAQAALGMAADHPLGGVGLGNFGDRFSEYRPDRAEETRFAHDDALQVLAETGAPGIIAIAIAVVGVLVVLLRGLTGPTRAEPDGERAAEPGAGAVDAASASMPPAATTAATTSAATAPGSAGAGDRSPFVATLVGILFGATTLVGLLGRYAEPDAALRVTAIVLLAWASLRLAVAALADAAPLALRIAALSSAAALGVSSLLDFPSYAHGLQAAAALVIAIGLALAPAASAASERPAWQPPRAVIGGLALGATAIALVLCLGYLRPLLAADLAAVDGREAFREALTPSSVLDPDAPDEASRRERLDAAAVSYAEARAHWPRGLRLALGEATARLARHKIGRDPGDRAAAIAALDDAVALAPYHAGVAARLGEAHLAGWRPWPESVEPPPPEAIEAYEQAITLYPSHPGYRLTTAILLDAAGRREEAAEQAREALRMTDRVRNYRLLLGPGERALAASIAAGEGIPGRR